MPTDLIFIISAAILFFSLSAFIALFVILHKRRQSKFKRTTAQLKTEFNQQLLQSQLEMQEYSFNQIGLELHDNIGQLLTTTKLLLGVIEVGIQNNNMDGASGIITTAKQTLSKAIHELRSLSKSLNHDWLYQFDLLENLRLETERICTSKNMQVDFQSDYEKLPFNSEAQVLLFRVVQEALQNIIRHAEAKEICLHILHNEDVLKLIIKDDGIGFENAVAEKKSLGLRNMQHRIRLLGGTIEWKTSKEAGTAVIIEIPEDKLGETVGLQ